MAPEKVERDFKSLFIAVGILIFIIGAYHVITKLEIQYISPQEAISCETEIKVRFSLIDGFDRYVSSDGKAEVRIVSEGETVYTGEFNIERAGFGRYVFPLTGRRIFAYTIKIPKVDVKKSVCLMGTGTVYLKYRTNGHRFREINMPIIGLPVCVEKAWEDVLEEIEQMLP